MCRALSPIVPGAIGSRERRRPREQRAAHRVDHAWPRGGERLGLEFQRNPSGSSELTPVVGEDKREIRLRRDCCCDSHAA
jgi:hypothetical protein